MVGKLLPLAFRFNVLVIACMKNRSFSVAPCLSFKITRSVLSRIGETVASRINEIWAAVSNCERRAPSAKPLRISSRVIFPYQLINCHTYYLSKNQPNQ